MGRRSALFVALVALIAVVAAPLTAVAQPAHARGRYIVVLKRGGIGPAATARELADRHGLAVGNVFTAAIEGFAATMPDAVVDRLRRDPRIARIEPDRPARLVAERLPTGVDRIGADVGNKLPTQAGAPVAVIDTGIAKAHPDLNVAGGYDCTSTYRARYGDADGHGTHVAGIIGATNTGSGVVGVAPGTPLYGVRVFDAEGYGSDATVICGIDWVTKNATAKGIKVTNLSLVFDVLPEDQNRCGSTGTPTTALHEAICRLTASGVTVVVAAGNEGKNASTLAPATYPEVVTVSALADSNGCLGESGGAETRATFSNYGADVDVAAPGVNIDSTYLRGGYETISGTSMAAPHVAGTIARNVKRLGRATWAEEASGTLPEGIVKASAATSCG